MHANFDDELKGQLKIAGKKRKKSKRDNLNVNEKVQSQKSEKKGKKAMHDNFGDDLNELVRKDKKRKMGKHLQTSDERNSIFDNFQMCSVVDPSILTIPAFRLSEEDLKSAVQEGPMCICDICWKFKFRKNVIKLS